MEGQTFCALVEQWYDRFWNSFVMQTWQLYTHWPFYKIIKFNQAILYLFRYLLLPISVHHHLHNLVKRIRFCEQLTSAVREQSASVSVCIFSSSLRLAPVPLCAHSLCCVHAHMLAVDACPPTVNNTREWYCEAGQRNMCQ